MITAALFVYYFVCQINRPSFLVRTDDSSAVGDVLQFGGGGGYSWIISKRTSLSGMMFTGMLEYPLPITDFNCYRCWSWSCDLAMPLPKCWFVFLICIGGWWFLHTYKIISTISVHKYKLNDDNCDYYALVQQTPAIVLDPNRIAQSSRDLENSDDLCVFSYVTS